MMGDSATDHRTRCGSFCDMAKRPGSLAHKALIDERCDAGLLRMLKTSTEFRPAKKRRRRKPTAIKSSNKAPVSDAATIDSDAK
jgi:hypothetical protein